MAKKSPTIGILLNEDAARPMSSPTLDNSSERSATPLPNELIRSADRTTAPMTNPNAPPSLSIVDPIDATALALDCAAFADAVFALAVAPVALAAAL